MSKFHQLKCIGVLMDIIVFWKNSNICFKCVKGLECSKRLL